jgi:hypothetical protein
MKRGLILLLVASAALTLTCASVLYQRVGPTQIIEGEGSGCPTAAPCRVPVLGAGFPLAYLVDNPGVSVRGALHLVEDEFRPEAFALDFMIYFILSLMVVRLLGAWHPTSWRVRAG